MFFLSCHEIHTITLLSHYTIYGMVSSKLSANGRIVAYKFAHSTAMRYDSINNILEKAHETYFKFFTQLDGTTPNNAYDDNESCTIETPPLKKEGWLKKMGNSIKKDWKPRFVVLQNNVLRYFDSELVK